MSSETANGKTEFVIKGNADGFILSNKLKISILDFKTALIKLGKAARVERSKIDNLSKLCEDRPLYFKKKQSWTELNRGKLSKKDKRK